MNTLTRSILAIIVYILARGSALSPHPVGRMLPITLPSLFDSAVISWVVVLFPYVFLASTLLIDILLHHRDHLNSHQFLVIMGILGLGLNRRLYPLRLRPTPPPSWRSKTVPGGKNSRPEIVFQLIINTFIPYDLKKQACKKTSQMPNIQE